MINMIRHGIEHRFIRPAVLDELLHIHSDPSAVIAAICDAAPPTVGDNDRFMPMGGAVRE
jgi:hypothetical protein